MPATGRSACSRTTETKSATASPWRAQLLRADGPVKAYAYLHGDGKNLIPHLGPSFGTKVLYWRCWWTAWHRSGCRAGEPPVPG
jgi:Putative 8-oxoguanine DNA glycosylase OGG-like protein